MLKLDTHMGKGLIYCVHQIQAARIYLFLYFSSFFCLSNWQRLKFASIKLFQLTSDGYGQGYVSFAHSLLYLHEPRHEKTCLRGFRPGKTQTGLLSYRN